MKTIEVPVFPGYLFGRFDLADRLRVLNAPGVAEILGCGKTPTPVSDTEIESVQAMVASRVALVPWPYLATGQRIRIDHGPLAGVEGIVIRADDNCTRVVVSVPLLQRSVAAEVERDWIAMAS